MQWLFRVWTDHYIGTDLFAGPPREVEVLADDFSLRERGIGEGELADGVSRASLEVVVDRLAAGTRTIWL